MVEASMKAKTGKSGNHRSFQTHVETPTFEAHVKAPAFGVPTVEVPAAIRGMAETSVQQARDGYERIKAASEEANSILENSYSNATKGSVDYGMKLIEASRVNTSAMFDFARDLASAKSMAEMMELSTNHARRQFETMTQQTQELTSLAQKVATQAAEPVRSGISKTFNKTSNS